MNCSSLATRNDFDAYIALLFNETHGNFTLLQECKLQVCTALWGQGNSDISGIGMLIAYVLEQALGLGLALTFCMLRLGGTKKRPVLNLVALRALDSFHDCATFFAFSIQLAAIVVLVRENFGISTAGMGDATVRVTQAISVLVLLPLGYNMLVPTFGPSDQHQELAQANELEDETRLEKKKNRDPAANTQRFLLFVVCWLLAFYPFQSAMNSWFGTSKIGSSSTAVISPEDFAEIGNMCTEGMQQISGTENALMAAFEILAFVPLSTLVLGRVLWLGIEKHHHGSRFYVILESLRKKHLSVKAGEGLQMACFVAIPLLASGLLWTVFRAQRLQMDMASVLESGDSDHQWTFGQVVAVTLFAPILVETWNAYTEGRGQENK
ncbi:hypothetical protein LTR97_006205 [Elasticomyces elasticus]|uniref:Uncharacterized protein n=1 Tax=Elasticomyces elasticus TaxID=574655 RepID=A0AAN7ZNM9_9PEZI|nr:hypothetical protein LTR97_006205 [Elasticomyces elasticus]